MKADGSGQSRLTNTAGLDENPAWSPDGKRIAFESARNGDDDIYVMNADGSAQTPLVRSPRDQDFPAWSPDGTKLAYAGVTGSGYDLFVLTLATGTIKHL